MAEGEEVVLLQVEDGKQSRIQSVSVNRINMVLGLHDIIPSPAAVTARLVEQD